ncbi:hypothetical protein AK88_03508 [Plasmodium fragile]|uniref:Mannosyltransferase n=1 Tax=Plasmodium fragile TaxID=5857 RepID=A0A0D9QIN4_PLAFR|nr:uncharacterized protein AK88_03508 [Plasmodium fragile]KJP86894.1 hypothetical protein AK88_03508 [Plasmodium fragile]
MIYGDFLKYGQGVVEKCTKSKGCLLYLILFRLLNCLVVQTSFFPDEYAQSIEISHYWVFGYGHKPWEWESCISLRSVVHPLTYAILFYVLKITQLDTPLAVLYAPRIFQGLCAALGDYGMIKLVTLWYAQLYSGVGGGVSGEGNGRGNISPVCAVLICHFLCWFHFYTICRTSSQSFECILNIWGVYFISRNYLSGVPAKGGITIPCSSESAKDKQSNQATGGTTVVRRGVLRSDERLAQEYHPPSSIIGSDDAWMFTPAGAAENGRTPHHAGGDEAHNQDDASTTGYYSSHQCVPHNGTTAVDKIKNAHIRNLLLSLLCSSFCVLIRPNAAPFWLCVYFLYLVKSAKEHKEEALRMEQVLTVGILYTLIFFLLGMVADSYYYKKITITVVNFFLYNFVSGQNSYFGEHPIHFYLSCVIPSIYLLFTPFTYYAFFHLIRNIRKERRRSLVDAVINRIDLIVYVATLLEVLSLSLSVHKEHKLLIGFSSSYGMYFLLQ